MNAVEIEEAISDLAHRPFDAAEYPFSFLAAFGKKDTALKWLHASNNNTSDVPGGVFERSNVHIAMCEAGKVGKSLNELRDSPNAMKAKTRFIIAIDGQTFGAEELPEGEKVTYAYSDFPDHFVFFLPLTGITTIKKIRENPIDVCATSRLNNCMSSCSAIIQTEPRTSAVPTLITSWPG
jgi:hypothetical protein